MKVVTFSGKINMDSQRAIINLPKSITVREVFYINYAFQAFFRHTLSSKFPAEFLDEVFPATVAKTKSMDTEPRLTQTQKFQLDQNIEEFKSDIINQARAFDDPTNI